MKLEKQLEIFLEDSPRFHGWLQNRKMRVFVRKSRHWIDGEMRDCLDLKNFFVYDRENRGKGLTKAFIEHAIKICPYPFLSIRDVIAQPDFQDHFRKNPLWILDPRSPKGAPAYYWKVVGLE